MLFVDLQQCSTSYNLFYPDWVYKEGDSWSCFKQVKDYPLYQKNPLYDKESAVYNILIIQYSIVTNMLRHCPCGLLTVCRGRFIPERMRVSQFFLQLKNGRDTRLVIVDRKLSNFESYSKHLRSFPPTLNGRYR